MRPNKEVADFLLDGESKSAELALFLYQKRLTNSLYDYELSGKAEKLDAFTPLAYCVHNDLKEMAKILLTFGADPQKTNLDTLKITPDFLTTSFPDRIADLEQQYRLPQKIVQIGGIQIERLRVLLAAVLPERSSIRLKQRTNITYQQGIAKAFSDLSARLELECYEESSFDQILLHLEMLGINNTANRSKQILKIDMVYWDQIDKFFVENLQETQYSPVLKFVPPIDKQQRAGMIFQWLYHPEQYMEALCSAYRASGFLTTLRGDPTQQDEMPITEEAFTLNLKAWFATLYKQLLIDNGIMKIQQTLDSQYDIKHFHPWQSLDWSLDVVDPKEEKNKEAAKRKTEEEMLASVTCIQDDEKIPDCAKKALSQLKSLAGDCLSIGYSDRTSHRSPRKGKLQGVSGAHLRIALKQKDKFSLEFWQTLATLLDIEYDTFSKHGGIYMFFTVPQNQWHKLDMFFSHSLSKDEIDHLVNHWVQTYSPTNIAQTEDKDRMHAKQAAVMQVIFCLKPWMSIRNTFNRNMRNLFDRLQCQYQVQYLRNAELREKIGAIDSFSEDLARSLSRSCDSYSPLRDSLQEREAAASKESKDDKASSADLPEGRRVTRSQSKLAGGK